MGRDTPVGADGSGNLLCMVVLEFFSKHINSYGGFEHLRYLSLNVNGLLIDGYGGSLPSQTRTCFNDYSPFCHVLSHNFCP